MTYTFDWTGFPATKLQKINCMPHPDEDTRSGFVPVKTSGNTTYMVDIHYHRYNAVDKGFDLEVYQSDDMHQHVKWLGSIKDIKSATDYNRFCRRAENLVLSLIQE